MAKHEPNRWFQSTQMLENTCHNAPCWKPGTLRGSPEVVRRKLSRRGHVSAGIAVQNMICRAKQGHAYVGNAFQCEGNNMRTFFHTLR